MYNELKQQLYPTAIQSILALSGDGLLHVRGDHPLKTGIHTRNMLQMPLLLCRDLGSFP